MLRKSSWNRWAKHQGLILETLDHEGFPSLMPDGLTAKNRSAVALESTHFIVP